MADLSCEKNPTVYIDVVNILAVAIISISFVQDSVSSSKIATTTLIFVTASAKKSSKLRAFIQITFLYQNVAGSFVN